MLGFFGKLFLGFLAVIVVLGVIGFFVKKRGARQVPEEEVLSEKTVSNVADLNDLFNRARYMDQDEN